MHRWGRLFLILLMVVRYDLDKKHDEENIL